MKNKVNGITNNYISVMLEALQLISKIPVLFLGSCVIAIISSVLQVWSVVAGQYLYDTVESLIGQSYKVGVVLSILLIFGIVRILNLLFMPLSEIFDVQIENKITTLLNTQLNLKMRQMEPVFWESSENLSMIENAKEGAVAFPKILISFKWILFYYGPYFGCMMLYLYNLRPVLIWCILLIIGPMSVSQLLNKSITENFINNSTLYQRQKEHYKKELIDPHWVKETQSLNLNSFILTKYVQSGKKYYEEALNYEKKQLTIQLISLVLYMLGYTISIFLLFDSVKDGYISVGAFASIFASIGDILSYSHMFVKVYISKFVQNCVCASKYHLLSNNNEYEKCDKVPQNKEIHLENVCFKYPGCNDYVLKNINLIIKQNETIAIVGENGAGKTTLANIICGIYRPTQGNAIINGMDVFDFPPEVREERNSVVLQDFGRYKMTLYENIVLGEREKCREDVEEIMANVNLNREFIHKNMNTILAREFGGIELSGGQWQHIAIARGVYKDAELIVLDEPTAALDPIAESHVYEKYTSISKKCTSIIISHRLGCIKFVDKVVFLKNGCVAGYDTHEKLLQNNKEYRKLYMDQARWYMKRERIRIADV